MPKADLRRHIDIRPQSSFSIGGVRVTSSSVATNELFVGRSEGPHVGLFSEADGSIFLEAVDTANVPFFSVGGIDSEANGTWLNIGYADQYGIRLPAATSLPGDPEQHRGIEVDAETLVGALPPDVIPAAAINSSMIDWGFGAGQVSAADVPVFDAGGYFASAEVEGALQELAGYLPFAGLLATGETEGATEQAQAFTLGVVAPFIAPAADGVAAFQMRKADGTTPVVTVDTAGGLVGIGTAAPVFNLHVAGNNSNTWNVPSFGVSSLTNAFAFIIADAASDNGIFWDSLRALRFGTAGATVADPDSAYLERMRITAGGLVGIGTATPATILHALSTTATTDALRNVLTLGANVTDAGVGAAGLGAAVLFQGETTTTVDSDMAQIGALWTTATHATRASALTFSTLTAGGSLTERMRIDGAGNVGIGTSAPRSKLDVQADSTGLIWGGTLSNFTHQAAIGPGVGLKFQLGAGAGTDELKKWAGVAGVAEDIWELKTGLAFYTNNVYDADPTEKMRISSAGNVGINDTAPAEALDVTGNINATGVVKVDDVQVLSNRVIDARAAATPDSGDATTDGLIDALRDAMVAHGLIAAA